MSRILYIDDNEYALRILKLFFKKEGFKVFLAQNTTVGRQILATEKIEFIISDIGLPGENGLQFYDWLQDQDEYKKIPFLFVSGHAVGYDDKLSSHKNIFLSKPIFYPDLIKRIKRELKIT